MAIAEPPEAANTFKIFTFHVRNLCAIKSCSIEISFDRNTKGSFTLFTPLNT